MNHYAAEAYYEEKLHRALLKLIKVSGADTVQEAEEVLEQTWKHAEYYWAPDQFVSPSIWSQVAYLAYKSQMWFAVDEANERSGQISLKPIPLSDHLVSQYQVHMKPTPSNTPPSWVRRVRTDCGTSTLSVELRGSTVKLRSEPEGGFATSVGFSKEEIQKVYEILTELLYDITEKENA